MSNDSVNMHMFIQTLSGRRLPTAVIQSRKKQKNRPMKRAPKSEPFFTARLCTRQYGLICSKVCIECVLRINSWKTKRRQEDHSTWTLEEKKHHSPLCSFFSQCRQKKKRTPYRLAYRSWSIWSRVCAETTIDKRRKKKQVCTRCTHRFCTTRQWLLKNIHEGNAWNK